MPTGEHRKYYCTKKIEMDRPCTAQRPENYTYSGILLETRETQETWTPQDHLEKDSGSRGSKYGKVMGHTEDAGSGPREIEGICCCPSCQWQEGQ
ncbi:hypothetical protein ElyMa_000890300 [Elysia marginata]|uniref:Uncharacterized protein n=1 Tax=Elysia marginata TaxID=1093978 RepID=A0AAV4H9A9_9GAST|nr:hypothetical protein ElyMa_000890300 [Elysia marginata]